MARCKTKHQLRGEKAMKRAKAQKEKFPEQLLRVIRISDIILEVVDARFSEEMRNEKIEEMIESKNKILVLVQTKSDLTQKRKEIPNSIFVSIKTHEGISKLRERIKIEAKRVKNIEDTTYNRIHVGVIGYPNSGKSSLINSLIGRTSAKASSKSGYTKGLQKLKFTSEILLIDSPGVIPERAYSAIDKRKISEHAKFSARSYSKVRDPEIVIHHLLQEYLEQLEKYYQIKTEGNSETLIEELGKRKRFIRKGGEVDEDKTARFILKEWQEGKISI